MFEIFNSIPLQIISLNEYRPVLLNQGIVFPFAMWSNLIRCWKMKAGSLISVMKSELVTPWIVSSFRTTNSKNITKAST